MQKFMYELSLWLMLLMSLVLGSLAEYTVYIVLSIPHYSMVPRKPENRLKSRKDLDLSLH